MCFKILQKKQYTIHYLRIVGRCWTTFLGLFERAFTESIENHNKPFAADQGTVGERELIEFSVRSKILMFESDHPIHFRFC
jgi:hypothetical protein